MQSALLGWFGGLASLKHYGNKALWQSSFLDIYYSIKEEEIFIYWVYFDILCGLGLVIYEMNFLCNLMYHYSCYVY